MRICVCLSFLRVAVCGCAHALAQSSQNDLRHKDHSNGKLLATVFAESPGNIRSHCQRVLFESGRRPWECSNLHGDVGNSGEF